MDLSSDCASALMTYGAVLLRVSEKIRKMFFDFFSSAEKYIFPIFACVHLGKITGILDAFEASAVIDREDISDNSTPSSS